MRGATFGVQQRLSDPVVAEVEANKQLPNWKVQVRKKAVRKKHLARRRKEGQQRTGQTAEQATLPSNALRWKGEPWRQHRRKLWQLQSGIYQAAKAGDLSVVEDLQSALLESDSAKSLAVRRSATTHPQRRVPGIDGVHTLDGDRQGALRDCLSLDGQSDPFEFVDITRAWREMRVTKENASCKDNSDLERICVCTMRDRAKQVLLSWALEPYLESLFGSASILSHRPGRSVQDLLHWLLTCLDGSPSYVMLVRLVVQFSDGISQCVNAQFSEAIANQVQSWISAGLFQQGLFQVGIGRHAEEQSCPILPLLSNNLCYKLMKQVPHLEEGVKIATWSGSLILVAPSETQLRSVQNALSASASTLGLTAEVVIPVQPAHKDWVDVLEFRLKQHRLRRSGKYTCLIQPREGVLEHHLDNLTTAFRLSDVFHEDKSGLINRLNPIIEAFRFHFSLTDAADLFEAADEHLKHLLVIWTIHNNPSLSEDDAIQKEFNGTHNHDLGFEFKTRIVQLLCHGDALREYRSPHIPTDRSPYDGDKSYWKGRLRHWEYNINPSFL